MTRKQEFRMLLWPMLDLFEHKKSTLAEDKWIEFVTMSKERIISNPEQFLGKDLPSGQIIKESIEEVFNEYLIERNSPALVS